MVVRFTSEDSTRKGLSASVESPCLVQFGHFEMDGGVVLRKGSVVIFGVGWDKQEAV